MAQRVAAGLPPGMRHVAITPRRAKLTTETVPAERFETYNFIVWASRKSIRRRRSR